MTINDKVEIIPATDSSAAFIRSWHSSESYTTCVDLGGLVGPYRTADSKDLIPLDPNTVQPQPDSQPTDDSSTDTQEIDGNTSANINNADSTNNNQSTSGGGAPTIPLLMTLFILLVARRQTGFF